MVEVFLKKEKWTLRDLESRNGSVVDGRPVKGDYALKPGDMVRIANTQLAFVDDLSQAFSEATGGRFFFVKKASDLAGVYEKIAEELRTQYYLAYSTANEEWDGRWMKVRVDNRRPDIKVRSRRGYFAVRKSDDG